MAQSVLGRTPSRPYAHTGLSDYICREASRLTARRYKLACRRAGREAFYARFSRRASAVILFALSLSAIPFRAVSTFFVYASAGAAARARHAGGGKSFSMVPAGTNARRKHNHARVNMALAFIAVCVLLFAASIYRVGLEVILDGESIGYVSSQSVVDSSLAAVSEQAGEILGRPFTIVPDISYRFSIVNKNKIFDNAGVEAGLLSGIPDIDRLCVLTIDGQLIGAAWTPSELQNILNGILSKYPEGGQAVFIQDVSIQSRLAPVSLLRSNDEMKTILNGTARGGSPLLSVQYIEQISYFDVIRYETEHIDDATLWQGETKLITEGVDGEAWVTAKQSTIDGFGPEIEVTSSIIVTEPVAEVIAVGTRHRFNTGTFIRPYYGQISSKYGMRKLNGVWGMHTGVDFRGPRGDPIIAADGGIVEFTGTRPGYGLTVIIDHQNGFKTVYGHCSKVHVTQGQRIGQGEHIANIGSTGRSTGNHVHFEIQVNGVSKDPMNYLAK